MEGKSSHFLVLRRKRAEAVSIFLRWRSVTRSVSQLFFAQIDKLFEFSKPLSLVLQMASPGLLPRRPLGSTGLEVSVIGFGASPLGSVFSVSETRLNWKFLGG